MNLSIFNENNGRYEGVVDSYQSLRWRKKYYEPGEFELHLPVTFDNITLLQIGRLIHLYDKDETGVIEKISLEDKDMNVSGRMLSCCLDNCYINTSYNFFNKRYGEVMETLVRNHGKMQYCNPLLNINSIYYGTDTLNSQIGVKNLLSVLTTLSKTSNISFKMYLDIAGDYPKWQFNTYEGVNRSVSQKINPPVIFSDEYGNLTNPSYMYDNTKYKNHALVLGEGQWPNRVQVEVISPEDIC